MRRGARRNAHRRAALAATSRAHLGYFYDRAGRRYIEKLFNNAVMQSGGISSSTVQIDFLNDFLGKAVPFDHSRTRYFLSWSVIFISLLRSFDKWRIRIRANCVHIVTGVLFISYVHTCDVIFRVAVLKIEQPPISTRYFKVKVCIFSSTTQSYLCLLLTNDLLS